MIDLDEIAVIHAPAPSPAKAKPTAAPSLRRERETLGRVPPNSIEAEENLLSCCLIDGGDVVARCIDAKIAPASFYVPANRVTYGKLLDLYNEGKPIDLVVLAEELKTTRQLEEIGGYPYLTRISGRIPTTAQSSYFIEKVRELHTLREVIKVANRAVESAYAYEGNLEEFTQQVDATMQEVLRAASGKETFEAVPITAFRYPTTEDPNSLLGHEDWLGRGGGMLFVSHAGAGKSSCIFDACLTWARALPFMKIPAKKGLKFLVIQSEDSERYIGKVFDSYRAANNLTDEEMAYLEKHVLTVKVKGVAGDGFMQVLEQLIKKHRPDIVVINPVYLYIDGSVSDDETAQRFLNLGLDRINARTGDRVAYILVHHTGKPPKANEEKRETMDWETVYAGIGTSFWANWPRCSMLLEPRAQAGRYYLRLGKAGKNAGVMREWEVGGVTVREPVTRLPIKHSEATLEIDGKDRPMIYWESDTDDIEEVMEKPTAEKKKKGRESHYTNEEIVSYFPHAISAGESNAVVERKVREGCGAASSSFYRMRAELLQWGWITQLAADGNWRRTAIGDDYANVYYTKLYRSNPAN